ncbi:MAG: FapA family protein, partial [bacterium]
MEKTIDIKSAIAVKISPDRMKAHVVLPRDPNIAVGPDDLRTALSEAGVCYGIREDLFEKICAQPRNGLPLLIAGGKPPERGKDGQIEFLIPTERTHKPQVDEHGKANWYEMNLVNNVNAGQVLARAVAPTHGEPGRTVLGEELRGLLGTAVSLPVGINTLVAKDDPGALVAKEAGSAVYDHGKIHVMTTYEIAGSVDFDTGNVTTVGSAKILGDVKSGFVVKSGGNVEVRGFVEDATIVAEGNILVRGGFVGSGLGRLVAGKDVVVHFIENQTIEAKGNVRIEKHALNANIETRGKVIFLDPTQGQLIGGQVIGIESLELGSIGNENDTRTEVRAGATAAMVQNATQLQENLDGLLQSLEQMKTDIGELAHQKYKTGLPREEEERFANLKRQKDDAFHQVGTLQKQLEEHLAEITRLEKATIRVQGKIHNNVRACIGRFVREFETPR